MTRVDHSAERRGLLSLLALAVICGLGAGCSGPESVSADDEVAITTMLGAYLPRFAEVYRTGNVALLEGYASQKERAELEKRIRDLAAEGREVHPSIQQFEVEQIEIFSHSNAFVTTLEVWDLKVVAAGTERLLSEVAGQRSRVKYQLKRRDEGWQVLYRRIETTFS